MPVVLSSPMMATTHGLCSTISATGTSSIRSDTPKWRQTGSRTFGEADLSLGHLGAAASGRRQARDDFRFPLNHLGIRARLALRKQLLDKLMPRSSCSSVIALTPPVCSNFISRGTSIAQTFKYAAGDSRRTRLNTSRPCCCQSSAKSSRKRLLNALRVASGELESPPTGGSGAYNSRFWLS
jgi:hypothetical protein